MVIIKGPFKMSGGFDSRKMAEKLLGDPKKMKLPFKATGWRSSKNSDLIDGGKQLGSVPEKEVKEKVKKVEKKLKEVKEKPKKKSIFRRK